MLLFDRLIRLPGLAPQSIVLTGLAVALAFLPLTFVQALSWRRTTRRFDDWESLDLDEGSAA
jgi:hypothetical protein